MFPCVTKSNRTLEKRHLLLWCNNHRLAFLFIFSPFFLPRSADKLTRVRTMTKFKGDTDNILEKRSTFRKNNTFAECLDMCRIYSFNEENILAKKISALSYTWSKNVHLMYIEQLGWWPNNDSNQYYGGRLLRPVGVEGWSWGRCCKKKTWQDINRVKVAVRPQWVAVGINPDALYIVCIYILG